MFPCMVGRASVDVIFSGMAGSRDCALQLVLFFGFKYLSFLLSFFVCVSFKALT